MAYLQGRAGVMRAGVTYAALSAPKFRVFIGGTDRTRYVRLEDGIILSETLMGGSPTTFTFSLKGYEPVIGTDIKVQQTQPNDYLFGGTITQREAVVYGSASGKVHWNVVATGYVWLMNRYALVTERFSSLGINTIAARILATYTNGGFRIGYAPSSLGNASIDFTFETVEGCLNRLCEAAGSDVYWECTPDKVVNIFNSYPDPNAPALTLANIDIATLTYREDNTPIRTRVVARGSGSSARTTYGAGTTIVGVEYGEPFSAAGGMAVSDQSIFSYTGKAVASDADGSFWNLTGCTSVDYDIPAGAEVQPLVEVNDSTKQTDLAGVLGGGLSGIAVYLLDAPEAGAGQLTALATSDLAIYGESSKAVSFLYHTPPRRLRVGRVFAASLTAPFAVSGSFRIQVIDTEILARMKPTRDQLPPAVTYKRRVSASRAVRSLTGILRTIDTARV